jgi:hypothetical protein
MSVPSGKIVVIDDGDPRIQYWVGDWFVRGEVGEIGRWGPPKMNALHGLRLKGSLSFEFYGKPYWISINEWSSYYPI